MAKRNRLTLALAALFVLGLAAGATAGIPNSENSPAYADNCGRFTIAPSGGEDLVDPGAGNAYMVHLTVNDINGDPVTTLAATDMWLDAPGQLVGCQPLWNQADSGTDINGHTSFSGTIYGGVIGDASNGQNCNNMLLYVYALGIQLNSGNDVCVAIDSPDLNGSLSVTLADFTKFVTDYNCVGGACDPCHDYNESGNTSLADFSIFATYYNASVCP